MIEHNDVESNKSNIDFILDFTTSSTINKIGFKFLIFYIPIFWFSGLMLGLFWLIFNQWGVSWILKMFLIPVAIFLTYFIFICGCAIISKLFLILLNLIHKPKEGIFKAVKGDKDFEFWVLRTELKKLNVWLMNNFPLPWINVWAFRWFGVKMDFSSSLYDAWCDLEFIKFGRKVMVGQGAVIMSSMVVGKYLIIQKVVIDDYTVIGGLSTIAPGVKIGKEAVLGAFCTTSYKQVLDPGWVYF